MAHVIQHKKKLLARVSRIRGQINGIERALEEMVKRLKARRMLELGGSGIWSGDLSTMRGDAGAVFESGSASGQRAARERPAIYRPRAKKR